MDLRIEESTILNRRRRLQAFANAEPQNDHKINDKNEVRLRLFLHFTFTFVSLLVVALLPSLYLPPSPLFLTMASRRTIAQELILVCIHRIGGFQCFLSALKLTAQYIDAQDIR